MNNADEKDLRVEGAPTKEFFIDMLTKDIRVMESVLDLLDNSIDSLLRHTKIDVTTLLTGKPPLLRGISHEVSINLSIDKFRITDNCGGIPVEFARKNAFRFGLTDRSGTGLGLGAYGIGMKRAFFRLGRKISVESISANDRFIMDIDVDAWKKEPDNWDFRLTTREPKGPGKGESAGTKIVITELKDEVRDIIAQSPFVSELRKRIAKGYALFMKAGLRIVLNDVKIEAELPEVIQSKEITPVYKQFERDGVNILIIAGLTGRTTGSPQGGWYVFCNGRMIAGPERTYLTGWGYGGFPAYHSKYNNFVGFIYFRSTDVSRLPWDTTKSEPNFESRIYQYAMAEMQVQARGILDFLNTMYPGEVPLEGVKERVILDSARAISIDKMKKKESSFSVSIGKTAKEEIANINYSKPLEEVDRIRENLGKKRMSYRKVGEYTFEYYLKKECGND